jgi:hypothetical protein
MRQDFMQTEKRSIWKIKDTRHVIKIRRILGPLTPQLPNPTNRELYIRLDKNILETST